MSEQRRTRQEYERGLPDHHDPTGGLGGAPPALSALTLRVWLAGFGVLTCTAGAVAAALLGVVWLTVVLAVLAAIAVVDVAWITHRKRRGEPG